MPCTLKIDDRYSVTIRSDRLPRDAGWESTGDIFVTKTCRDIGVVVWAEGSTMPIAEDRVYRRACERILCRGWRKRC